jgi:O-acetyl-ADP-ribose deacetylase (regulator of RNase III)
MITYIKGDVTNPLGSGLKVIAHIVNDIGKMGAGVALAISNKWPDTRTQYLEWYRSEGFGLGQTLYVKVRPDIIVANMVAQAGVGTGSKGPPIRYDALAKCLQDLAKTAEEHKASVHMPRIGCFLAGGRWSQVEPLIQLHLAGIPVTVYDQSGGRYNP